MPRPSASIRQTALGYLTGPVPGPCRSDPLDTSITARCQAPGNDRSSLLPSWRARYAGIDLSDGRRRRHREPGLSFLPGIIDRMI
jgi:hypothetical protein